MMNQIKYSEIRDWVVNYLEHCSKEDIVRLYARVELDDRPLAYLDVEWDE